MTTPASPTSPWPARAFDAIARRARSVWQQVRYGERCPAAEAALAALLQSATPDGLAPTRGAATAVCPGLTAAAIATLWDFGETDLALAWAKRLLRLQKFDGSLPDAALRHTSLFNTAQAAKAFALLEQSGRCPDASRARRRACDFLASRIGRDGLVRVPESGGSFERWAPATVGLAGLATVIATTEHRHATEYRDAVCRAVDIVLRTTDVASQSTSLHVATHGIEALLDLADFVPEAGRAAREFLDRAALRQRRDGSVAADAEQRWVSSAGLAHLACLWFRTGNTEAGNRAVACLTARQRDDGTWTGSWGRRAAYFPNQTSLWTAKLALDAMSAQVSAAFAVAPYDLLEPPSADDARLRVVADLVGSLPAETELVDVGCGGGRFLTALRDRFPRASLTGVDPSTALLRHVPKSCATVLGDARRLPLDSARYDVAITIEALEHALVPQRAVAELCRVVRPGGRVLVIDKDRRFQRLSRCEPWEQWFRPETVASWLAQHCDDVETTALPSGPHARTPGLFVCWQGVRRGDAMAATTLRRAA
jgi:malonyl-CoA O-methyltransferase